MPGWIWTDGNVYSGPETFRIRYSERAQSEMYEIITEEIDHLQKEIRQENREVPAH